MAAFTPEQLAELAALLGAASAPATSAPRIASIASPFATASTAKASTVPAHIAAILAAHPGDRKAQRLAVAVTLEPGWTCTIDTEAVLTDGSTVPAALHGYTYAHKSGEPCNGVRGLPAGTACPGTVR